MGNKTPLYEKHKQAKAKIVDFGGWDMPVNYGSQLEEHHIVRNDAGVFDVSHMTVVDVRGEDSRSYLRTLLANDVDRLSYKGKALYSAMLNEKGGIIDDLIVYNMDGWYRLIVNCATREKDLAWMKKQAKDFDIEIEEKSNAAMLAVQGPNARTKVASIIDSEAAEIVNTLKIFQGLEHQGFIFARTGYTGEDGLEIILPMEQVESFWDKLLAAGVAPIGLGARDTLRLEAGMNLYGSDMDESVSPLESGMAWTVAWEEADRKFIGREALEKQKHDGVQQVQVGLVMEERAVLRGHQKVFVDTGEGEITSGTFSPTLGFSIALARIPKTEVNTCEVEIRGKRLTAEIVKPPFVRNGKQVFVKT